MSERTGVIELWAILSIVCGNIVRQVEKLRWWNLELFCQLCFRVYCLASEKNWGDRIMEYVANCSFRAIFALVDKLG